MQNAYLDRNIKGKICEYVCEVFYDIISKGKMFDWKCRSLTAVVSILYCWYLSKSRCKSIHTIDHLLVKIEDVLLSHRIIVMIQVDGILLDQMSNQNFEN